MLISNKYKSGIAEFFCLFIMASGIYLSVVSASNDSVSTDLNKGVEVPAGVKVIVDAYLKNSKGAFFFDNAKSSFNKMFQDIDSNVEFSDIQTGTPVHLYRLNIDKLVQEPDSFKISLLVIPTDVWLVPIITHGRILYIVHISKIKGSTNTYRIVENTSSGDKGRNWESAKKLWPESSGYYPIYIDCDHSQLFHFPQIDDHNLLMLNKGYVNPDSFSLLFHDAGRKNDPSYGEMNHIINNVGDLIDNRKAFEILRTQELERRQREIERQKLLQK